jgi:hypothetical protein
VSQYDEDAQWKEIANFLTFVIIVVTLSIFTAIFFSKDHREFLSHCKDKGGIVIDGKCLKVEEIK